MTLADRIAQINAKSQKWVDEDPTNRWAGMLVADLNHWNTYGIHTADELDKYLLVSEFSDSYKSIHGIRPRWMNLNEMTIDEIKAELKNLYSEAVED